jgi:hypothetical protein
VARKGKPRLIVGFKPKITRKSRGSVPYVYGSALNYGAVRKTGGNLGEKAKRSLKKAALQQTISARAARNLLKGDALRHERRKKHKSVNFFAVTDYGKHVRVGNGIVIMKPRPFFQFTPAQADEIQKLFAAIVARNLGSRSAAAAA